MKLQTQEIEKTNFYELLSEKGLNDAERVLQEPFSCFVKKMPEVELETEETKETEETNFYKLLTERGLDDAERVVQDPFSRLVKKMPDVVIETQESKETDEIVDFES